MLAARILVQEGLVELEPSTDEFPFGKIKLTQAGVARLDKWVKKNPLSREDLGYEQMAWDSLLKVVLMLQSELQGQQTLVNILSEELRVEKQVTERLAFALQEERRSKAL